MKSSRVYLTVVTIYFSSSIDFLQAIGHLLIIYYYNYYHYSFAIIRAKKKIVYFIHLFYCCTLRCAYF